MVWFSAPTSMTWTTLDAARKFASPACEAVIVQVPVPVKVTVPETSEHCPLAASEASSPESSPVTVLTTLAVGSYVPSGTGSSGLTDVNAIVCPAWATVSMRVTGVAGR